MAENRRKYERISVSIKVQKDDGETLGIIKELSLGGCFVETDTLIPKDSIVSINFILPDEVKDVRTRGRVASIRENPIGMGIEFYAIAPEYRTILRNFIKEVFGDIHINDKRESFRLEINLSVYAEDNTLIGLTKDISTTGISLFSDKNFQEHTTMSIKFTLPKIKKEITVKAEFLSCYYDNCYGLKFTDISELDKRLIENFITDLSGSKFI